MSLPAGEDEAQRPAERKGQTLPTNVTWSVSMYDRRALRPGCSPLADRDLALLPSLPSLGVHTYAIK
jgi:hypothetical protein